MPPCNHTCPQLQRKERRKKGKTFPCAMCTSTPSATKELENSGEKLAKESRKAERKELNNNLPPEVTNNGKNTLAVCRQKLDAEQKLQTSLDRSHKLDCDKDSYPGKIIVDGDHVILGCFSKRASHIEIHDIHTGRKQEVCRIKKCLQFYGFCTATIGSIKYIVVSSESPGLNKIDFWPFPNLTTKPNRRYGLKYADMISFADGILFVRNSTKGFFEEFEATSFPIHSTGQKTTVGCDDMVNMVATKDQDGERNVLLQYPRCAHSNTGVICRDSNGQCLWEVDQQSLDGVPFFPVDFCTDGRGNTFFADGDSNRVVVMNRDLGLYTLVNTGGQTISVAWYDHQLYVLHNKAGDAKQMVSVYNVHKSSVINALKRIQMGRKTQCPACLEDLVNPRLLPCGHTFCSSCLEMWNKKGQVQCYICKVLHRVPETGVQGFTENLELVELLAERKRKQQQQPPPDDVDADIRRLNLDDCNDDNCDHSSDGTTCYNCRISKFCADQCSIKDGEIEHLEHCLELKRARGALNSEVIMNRKKLAQLLGQYDPKHCSGCGKLHAKLGRCFGCSLTKYCSKKCQTEDWKDGHKDVCHEIQRRCVTEFYSVRFR